MANELNDIVDSFELIEDWDERYRYLIELGRGLEPLPDAERTDENKVRGCASQVWLSSRRGADGSLFYRGDSDAHIVRGLVRLIVAAYSGKRPSEIMETDTAALFQRLGLAQHLTPQRSNGVRSMVERIKSDARAALAGV